MLVPIINKYKFCMAEYLFSDIHIIYSVISMGEDFPYKEEVIGSNPIPSTICGCSSIGRALRCQRKGCGIVPHHPLQYAALVDHLAQLPSKQQNRGKHSDAAPYIR